LLTKNGGSIATAGAVSRLFHRKGQIVISREQANEDQLLELVMEAGAEDLRTDADGFEVITDPAQFETVHKTIERRGIKCEVAEVSPVPALTTPVADPAGAMAVNRLIELLEDHDDVKEVYSNAEFSDASGKSLPGP
jgi:transcriptional/translational regulatory protein YebC/TACO1